MNCNNCAETIRSGENFCRGCGSAVTLNQHRWSDTLEMLGHYALGFLIYGLFTTTFLFLSYDLIRLTPFARFLVFAVTGGAALGCAIHRYSKGRRQYENRLANGALKADAAPELLSPATPISFISASDSLATTKTTELRVPAEK